MRKYSNDPQHKRKLEKESLEVKKAKGGLKCLIVKKTPCLQFEHLHL